MPEHIPVLLAEVIRLADPKIGETVCDGTVGLGGHSAALLKLVGEEGKLIGCDADERNLALARANLRQFPNVTLLHTNFREIGQKLTENSCDIILLDLGISSLHLDDATRGFAFKNEGPLDMRLDAGQKLTAETIVNHYSADELTQIFREYGEIRSARPLAQGIIQARLQKPLTTTSELKAVVESISGKILATTFQALRIAVNDELGALRDGLAAAEKILKPGGRLIVISFHSLEDRIVKNFFRERKRKSFTVLTKKPIVPTAEEVENNPRSRSAKLRAARKQ